jgi:glycosyltransferase involved in cell wall biosynthesis
VLQAPESLTPPDLVYERAKRRGMDFVTITDLNSIDGVMSIAHLPGVLTGEEVRTTLHGSRAVVHILVYGLTPADHDEICRARDCFEDLAALLAERSLPFALAHPLVFPGGGSLTFEDFRAVVRTTGLVETLNGHRPQMESEVLPHVVRAVRDEPGFCAFTGGSDDHCGRFIGQTWTSVPGATTPAGFLDGLREGRCSPGGSAGGALKAAYSVYSIAYSFYRDRMLAKKLPHFASAAADRFFMSGPAPEPTLWHRLDHALHSVYHKAVSTSDPGPEAFLLEELLEVGRDLWADARDSSERIDERTFQILSSTTNRLLDRFGGLLLKRITDGRIFDAIEAASALIPVLLLNAPYPIAYSSAARGRKALAGYRSQLPGLDMPRRGQGARAWVTDTIDDLNGVSRTLQKISRVAVAEGKRLAVITSQSRPLSFEGWVVNLPPVREFAVPDYESKTLAIPPMLEMLRFLEENDFESIYISTPGPVGVAALLAAKLLGIPTTGIYHTDYPRHVMQIVQDGHLGGFATAATGWFYSATDLVMVPSRYYMKELETLGIPRTRMKLFPRGIDLECFAPCWRDESFFPRYGGSPDSVKLVYIGRVSREKDLDILADSLPLLRAGGRNVELFVVGDGPYLSELSEKLQGRGGHFCGVMKGEDLSRAYASADIFVFPSTTDTFGNVVLEAQASGVPAVVTDMGGPMEIIQPGLTGLIARGRDVASFTEAVARLCDDAALRAVMRTASRENAASRTWENAFRTIWDDAPAWS